ncbi:hypothetical protein SAY87_027950 [Trapa incisa]|uniref:intramembrane prenyl-peptidase Rce1 n=1 Tax=Trapa incisa TaxID=236973 RepID=A0AAN7KTU7_9MYRT|nr:hypothetical protein SAY87_027950 [Trapa incisa]
MGSRMEVEGTGVSKPVAVIACAGMTLFYVAIFYAPALILRLQPPRSFKEFMIRRFVCAAVSSVVSAVVCTYILPIGSWDASTLLGVYGIRADHILQAVIFPLTLSSLMYAGSMTMKLLLWLDAWKEDGGSGGCVSSCSIDALKTFIEHVRVCTSNIMFWRNIVVAPLTEELVFRACMISLLLCGGFERYSIIAIFPIFFSLAHLNHFMEVYIQQNRNILKASLVIGLQLGYTVVFGSYASFLLVRTGHLLSPLVAHIFCNYMGLPVVFSRKKGIISLAFVAGAVSFLWFLYPLTQPHLYNAITDDCRCWHGYCSWK